MVQVKGLDFRTVELPDLCDRVYFGQVRVFSPEQVSGSDSLRKAISQSRVAILGGEVPNTLSTPVPPSLPPPVTIERVIVEKSASEVQVVHVPVPSEKDSAGETKDLVLKLTEQIQELQRAMQSQTEETVKTVRESVGRVEKTVSGISVAGPGVSIMPSGNPRVSSDEVFIPSVLSVTDMSNHIKLETQQIGQGDSVNHSLQKLRALKEAQKAK